MRSTLFILVMSLGTGPLAAQSLPEVPPENLGFDAVRLGRLDEVIRGSIEKKEVPGAVVLVGRHRHLAYAGVFGDRAMVPTREPMTRDTAFDLASLTKPVATATSIMVLLEQGKLRLNDRLGELLPEFDNHGKGAITLEKLLRHRAGLIADNPIADFAASPEKAWENLSNLSLAYPPGEKYIYSDVGFLILGRIVERVSGESLDVFARKNVFEPLRMSGTGFKPKDPAKIAPTEPIDGKMLRGVVHDPRARALGGVAGHAGLFGTADDLAIYAATLLARGVSPQGARILGQLTVRAMTDAGDSTEAQERRGLGWDIDTPHSAPRGALFEVGGYGHTGFTGTSLWIDPSTGVFVVILTSRLHPDGKGQSPTSLRYRVATVAASAVLDDDEPEVAIEPRPAVSSVLCGIDILVRDKFVEFKGKRVGLVTNHTGVTREGLTSIDTLHKAPGMKLVALFSPEHGIRGDVDTEVCDSRDQKTGLPVFSLYGKTRKPSLESLKDVDVLVYDIQDIGTRYYTYMSTLGLVLEASKERGIPLYVLDRPNPIGGVAVDGPVRDPAFASFIAHHAVPVRHGMTVGEMALLFNKERAIGADLHVVKCEGWMRDELFDRTGLLWVNPSPNMRSLTEALLYPGIGLLEATNLATGRGTDTPFERVGAPWIEPVAFSNALNALELPGVRFIPVYFSPKERQFTKEICGGVYIEITERDYFEPVRLGIGIATTLMRLYPKDWKHEGFLKMIADDASYKAVLNGQSVQEVAQVWLKELDEFCQAREKYLLYR